MPESENPTPCEMRITLVRVKPDLVWLLHCGGCGRGLRHLTLVRNAKKQTNKKKPKRFKSENFSEPAEENFLLLIPCAWVETAALLFPCPPGRRTIGKNITHIKLSNMLKKNNKVKQKRGYCFTWLSYPLSWEAVRPLGGSSSCLRDKVEVNELIIPTTTPTCTAADNLRRR